MTRTVDCFVRVLRNEAELTRLVAPEDSPPVIRMNDSGEIKTSLSGVFRPNPLVDWYQDELQPVLVLDGVEYNAGVFMPATISEGRSDAGILLEVEAYDRAYRLAETKSEAPLHIAAGTNYISAIEQLLSGAGITLMQATLTDEVLPEALEIAEIGTSYLSVVNQLLSEIAYNDLWFDENGIARIEPYREPSGDQISHTFRSDRVRSLMLSGMQRSTDTFQAANVFVCVVKNPDKSTSMVATAVNDNPESPLSVSRRGRRITQVYTIDNIASQSALQAYANMLKSQSQMTGETIRFQTAIFPGFGVRDVVAFAYDEITALCIERAWTMTMQAGGVMSHTLERVVYNIG